jgi:hypothetical protein
MYLYIESTSCFFWLRLPSGATVMHRSDSTNVLNETRESWLRDAVAMLDPLFRDAGCNVPKGIAVSCGFPSFRALAKQRRRLGECWASRASRGGRFEIFISPLVDDSVDVLGIVVHELIHVVVGSEAGHGIAFKRLAVAVGLAGRMSATVPGDRLRLQLVRMTSLLGQYPHRALDASDLSYKKQGTRLIKVICSSCGYSARITRRWIAIGLPTCPCGTEMVVDQGALAM